MGILFITLGVIYGIIGILTMVFSGLIWGSTRNWGKFRLPNWVQFTLMFLSGLLWPIFLTWAKLHGPFNTGIFT